MDEAPSSNLLKAPPAVHKCDFDCCQETDALKNLAATPQQHARGACRGKARRWTRYCCYCIPLLKKQSAPLVTIFFSYILAPFTSFHAWSIHARLTLSGASFAFQSRAVSGQARMESSILVLLVSRAFLDGKYTHKEWRWTKSKHVASW